MKVFRPQRKALRSLRAVPSATTQVRGLIGRIDGLRAELSSQQRGFERVRGDLRHALERYEDLYQSAPVGFMTLDKRGRINQLNEKAAKLLGFSASWLLDRSLLVFIAKNEIQPFMDLLTLCRRTPGQLTMELDLVVEKRRVPVQILLVASLNDHKLTYQVTIVDLTDAKKIEQQLIHLLNNWHSLVHNAPDVIMTVERSGRITYVNRPCWGYSVKALLETRLSDYIPVKDRAKLEASLSKAFAAKGPSICEVLGVNGEKARWYSFSFGAVHKLVTTTTTTTTTVTIREITEQKDTEESLHASREQLREFAARLDVVREEERARIAREIHDELGQALTILKLDLSWLHGKTDAKNGARKKIKSMIGSVDQTIDQVRAIVSELRPSILDEMGLMAAVEWQVSQFQERTGIRGIFESNTEDLNLLPDTAAALFRIIQEALTNVLRHAEARQVRVRMRAARDILRITVTDDGKGVSPQQINDRRSFGLVGMRERVYRVGGEFNIVSGPGGGTRLEISAPLK